MNVKTFLNIGVAGVSEYKKAVNDGVIDEIRQEGSSFAIDNRTLREGNDYYVTPFATTRSQYLIVCPFCKGIHAHGKMDGHRVAHCRKSKGYFINAGKCNYLHQNGGE